MAKYLLSDAFKDPVKGQSAEQIDKDFLMMFGLLHCQDVKKSCNKIDAFYEILNEGGMTKHQHISAGDKDLKPTFKKMCALVTCELFDFSGLKVSYEKADRKELESSALSLMEDQWLEDMYGSASTLQNEAWVEQMKRVGKWIFDASELRARLFKESGVEVKHLKWARNGMYLFATMMSCDITSVFTLK